MDELPPDCAARVRAGDLQAFEALYRSMHAPLDLTGTEAVQTSIFGIVPSISYVFHF